MLVVNVKYKALIDDIRASFANRLNGNYFLQADVTVFDDGSQDQLSGSAGQDWFFANLMGAGVLDKITDLGKDEIATDI